MTAVLEPGSMLERYQIVEVVGEGKMSTVCRALDTRLSRFVALKVLHGEQSDAQQFSERFLIEARTLARLQHPGIVQVYDAGDANGILFLTMEWVDGHSLLDRLHHVGHLPIEEVVEITRQVADALKYAHYQGIIHRDIKPSNILLASDGRVKLSDFGLAMARGPSLTRTGMVLGSPGYMSPEQVRGEILDSRSDVFSLGTVLYQALTGSRPFRGESALELMQQTVYESPLAPRALRPEISPALEGVVLHAMAKDPAERFQTAGAFVEALEAQRATFPAGSLTISDPELVAGAAPAVVRPKGRRSFAGIATSVLVLFALLSGVALVATALVNDGVTSPLPWIPLFAVVLVVLGVTFWLVSRGPSQRDEPTLYAHPERMPQAPPDYVPEASPDFATPPPPHSPPTLVQYMEDSYPAEPRMDTVPEREWSTDIQRPLGSEGAPQTQVMRQTPEVAAFLLVLNGPSRGQKLQLSRDVTQIGRAQTNDVRVDDTGASRQHATIRLESGQFAIYDMGSSNGTLLNGMRTARAILKDRDEIRIGDTNLMFMHVASYLSADAQRRVREFDDLWDDLTETVRRD